MTGLSEAPNKVTGMVLVVSEFAVIILFLAFGRGMEMFSGHFMGFLEGSFEFVNILTIGCDLLSYMGDTRSNRYLCKELYKLRPSSLS